MIGGLSGYGYNPYSVYNYQQNIGNGAAAQGTTGVGAPTGQAGVGQADGPKTIKNPGESTQVQPGKKSSPAECQTCKERKYQDGSDEMVSFKAASHIAPEAAASAVRSHEQEHVNNAYKKAAQGNGEVLQASVAIKTAICPECGRSYVAGGTTTTQIKYQNESNPYQKDRKAQDAAALLGRNIDMAG